jgi:hypothetical protein
MHNLLIQIMLAFRREKIKAELAQWQSSPLWWEMHRFDPCILPDRREGMGDKPY